MRAVADQDHETLERWAGMADADTAVVQDAHLGGYPGLPARHRVATGTPPRLPAHRRPRHLHRRHAVPEVVEEGGAGDQRGQRQPAARGAGEPLRLRRLARLDAQPAARVRRRDRPRDRQLPRPDRVLRDLALPRRRVRGVLQGAQPEHDRARARGLLRLGASAARPPPRWCSPARSTSAPRRAPPYASWRRGSPRPRGSERSRLLVEQAELRAAMRAEKISEVAAEFDGIHNIHRAVDVGSVDAVIPAARLRPEIIAVIERSLGSARTERVDRSRTDPRHRQAPGVGHLGGRPVGLRPRGLQPQLARRRRPARRRPVRDRGDRSWRSSPCSSSWCTPACRSRSACCSTGSARARCC